MIQKVLYLYHLYLHQPVGDRLANTLQQVYYWKGPVTQSYMSVNMRKICEQFKKCKRCHKNLPPNIISERSLHNLVNIDPIFMYNNSTVHNNPSDTIILKDFRLAWMKMLDPMTVWFKTIQVP